MGVLYIAKPAGWMGHSQKQREWGNLRACTYIATAQWQLVLGDL